MSAAPGGAPLSSAMRPVRSRDCEQDPGGLQQSPLLFHLRFVCFLAASEDFSSRPASSLPFTHARARTSPTSPALPRVLWGKAIGRDDSPSAEQPPPRDSSTSPARPGLRGSGVDQF